jgi:hypothetical protein
VAAFVFPVAAAPSSAPSFSLSPPPSSALPSPPTSFVFPVSAQPAPFVFPVPRLPGAASQGPPAPPAAAAFSFPVPRSVGDDSSFAASASSAIARADPSPHLIDVVLPVRTNWLVVIACSLARRCCYFCYFCLSHFSCRVRSGPCSGATLVDGLGRSRGGGARPVGRRLRGRGR